MNIITLQILSIIKPILARQQKISSRFFASIFWTLGVFDPTFLLIRKVSSSLCVYPKQLSWFEFFVCWVFTSSLCAINEIKSQPHTNKISFYYKTHYGARESPELQKCCFWIVKQQAEVAKTGKYRKKQKKHTMFSSSSFCQTIFQTQYFSKSVPSLKTFTIFIRFLKKFKIFSRFYTSGLFR